MLVDTNDHDAAAKIQFLIFNIVVFAVFAAAIYWSYLYRKQQERFMREFAERHGYTYIGEPNMRQHIYEPVEPWVRTGTLFYNRDNPTRWNLVEGTSGDLTVSLFQYSFLFKTTPVDKHKIMATFTVFELDVRTALPHMLLAERRHTGSVASPIATSLPADFGTIPDGHQLTLEGNFNDFYTLFVEDEYEIEALQVFTPSFMYELISKYAGFNIEFGDRYIHVFEHGQVHAVEELDRMHELTQAVLTHLEPIAHGIGRSVEAMRSVAKH